MTIWLFESNVIRLKIYISTREWWLRIPIVLTSSPPTHHKPSQSKSRKAGDVLTPFAVPNRNVSALLPSRLS